MATLTIEIPVEAELAQIYTQASVQDKLKIQALFQLCLKEFANPTVSLETLMDIMGNRAQANGLTPEILETILADGN
jgi:hypothetical protein